MTVDFRKKEASFFHALALKCWCPILNLFVVGKRNETAIVLGKSRAFPTAGQAADHICDKLIRRNHLIAEDDVNLEAANRYTAAVANGETH